MANQISLGAIYCDDVRNEIGGKVSLMGVYLSDMVFPQFPALTPKFCARVSLRFPVESRPRESLIIQLFADDREIGRIEADQQQLQNDELPPMDADIPLEDRFLAMQTVVLFSPFQIEAPCRLRLRAHIDGQEIKGNGLKIRLPSAEERVTNGWPPEQEQNTLQ